MKENWMMIKDDQRPAQFPVLPYLTPNSVLHCIVNKELQVVALKGYDDNMFQKYHSHLLPLISHSHTSTLSISSPPSHLHPHPILPLSHTFSPSISTSLSSPPLILHHHTPPLHLLPSLPHRSLHLQSPPPPLHGYHVQKDVSQTGVSLIPSFHPGLQLQNKRFTQTNQRLGRRKDCEYIYLEAIHKQV